MRNKGLNINNELDGRSSFSVTDPLLFIEAVGDDPVYSSPFGCCIQEVLLCCHPSLREERIAASLSRAQRLETTLHILSSATDGTGRHSNRGFSEGYMANISEVSNHVECFKHSVRKSEHYLSFLSFNRWQCGQCSSGRIGWTGQSEAVGAGRSSRAVQHEAAASLSGRALPFRARRRSCQTRLCAQFPWLHQHTGICVSAQPWFWR